MNIGQADLRGLRNEMSNLHGDLHCFATGGKDLATVRVEEPQDGTADLEG